MLIEFPISESPDRGTFYDPYGKESPAKKVTSPQEYAHDKENSWYDEDLSPRALEDFCMKQYNQFREYDNHSRNQQEQEEESNKGKRQSFSEFPSDNEPFTIIAATAANKEITTVDTQGNVHTLPSPFSCPPAALLTRNCTANDRVHITPTHTKEPPNQVITEDTCEKNHKAKYNLVE
jgi:hypothetical protein